MKVGVKDKSSSISHVNGIVYVWDFNIPNTLVTFSNPSFLVTDPQGTFVETLPVNIYLPNDFSQNPYVDIPFLLPPDPPSSTTERHTNDVSESVRMPLETSTLPEVTTEFGLFLSTRKHRSVTGRWPMTGKKTFPTFEPVPVWGAPPVTGHSLCWHWVVGGLLSYTLLVV